LRGDSEPPTPYGLARQIFVLEYELFIDRAGDEGQHSFPGHRTEVTQRELESPSSRKSLFTGKFEIFDLTGAALTFGRWFSKKRPCAPQIRSWLGLFRPLPLGSPWPRRRRQLFKSANLLSSAHPPGNGLKPTRRCAKPN